MIFGMGIKVKVMKEDNISDSELLALIHKNIDIDKLGKYNKTITKTRIDKLLQDLKKHLEISRPSDSTEIEKDTESCNDKFDKLIIFTDGASKGNPGKSAIGVAIYGKNSKLVKGCSEYIGMATNNVAEYKAIILGIKEALKYKAKETLFKTDSELLAKQIKGEYRVKNPQLRNLFTEAQRLLKGLPKWQIRHIPREENQKADMLANKGIKLAGKTC